MKEYKVKVFENKTEWRFEGKKHRDNGPAIERSNGTKEWYQEGKKHRLDGPAADYSDGNKFWYKEGNRHRDNGPAIEYSSGTKEWYIEGKQLTEEEFNAKKCCPLNVTIGGVEYRLEKV